MNEYEISILNLLKKERSAGIGRLQDALNMNRDTVLWAVENLSINSMVKVERESRKEVKLTNEGSNYLKMFPEEELVANLYKSGGYAPIASMKNEIGLLWAKKNKWISIEKGKVKLTDKGAETAQGKGTYEQKDMLNKLAVPEQAKLDRLINDNAGVISSLRNRNLLDIIEKGRIKNVEITEKGAAADISNSEGLGALTREILASGRWEKDKLRPYDINASAEQIFPARQHPMHEFIDIVRNTWISMGFTEVSGPIIESAFWNFDALFSPQDHPTRDMQDTFFLKNPQKISIEDMALLNKVKRMHMKNWKEEWREDVAQQALLRTHTTSVSARYIKQFANNISANYPIKLFSVGKVFRNESIDYKHLAEMHQVDGIIIGNNLALSNLIHTLDQFYSAIGLENITIKPSYFPFVEPGLEVDYYDEEKKETIELCGAGIIRKEITKAMGSSKTVLAWGAGLERLMFKTLGIRSLTDLYKNDIGWLRERSCLEL